MWLWLLLSCGPEVTRGTLRVDPSWPPTVTVRILPETPLGGQTLHGEAEAVGQSGVAPALDLAWFVDGKHAPGGLHVGCA